MDYYEWDHQKNEKLKVERGISFEQVVMHIERGDVLALVTHPNQKKYPNQLIIVVAINEYAYLVPFIESSKGIFLKTIIPSRKATRDYIGGKMSKIKLNNEEKDILETFERGEWKQVKNYKAEVQKHQEYARKTLKKDKRVNIRISSKDLEEIQALALENGIPYQTLMSSVLHRYVHGSLIDKPRPNKAFNSDG